MKKNILKILIGALLIGVIVLFLGKQYYSLKKNEYKQQLEQVIDSKYLEGKNSIGAFYYYDNSLRNDSIRIEKVSSFNFDKFSWMLVSKVSFFGGVHFDHTDIITKMLTSGEYKWFEFKNCATTYRPFMIILKKTDYGYDIIGEYILGIGLKYSYPDYLITKTSYKTNLGKHSNSEDFIMYNYKIKTNLIDLYINNLFEEKYQNITIRNEITQENNGLKRNIKLDMLENLAMKGACPADSSLFFRVNKYFELKFDENFTEMGSSPIIWQTGTYGDYSQTIFTKTVTMHYSIQENKGILELEYKKKIIITLLLLEVFYFLVLIVNYRIKRLKLK